jgi:hypothetical protein
MFLLSLIVSFLLFLTLTLGVGYYQVPSSTSHQKPKPLVILYQYNCPVFTGCPISPISQTLVASFFFWNFGIVTSLPPPPPSITSCLQPPP